MRAQTRWAVLAAAIALAGCQKPAPPAAPTAAATPVAPLPPSLPDFRGERCEVEMGGQVQQIVTGNRAIAVYISPGDCAAPGARIIERAMASGDGSFFAEVWVPCDTTLTVCAAVEPRVPVDGLPKPTRRWGKLERALVATGKGEIEFFGLSWLLADHPDERTFARPQQLIAPPPEHTPRQH